MMSLLRSRVRAFALAGISLALLALVTWPASGHVPGDTIESTAAASDATSDAASDAARHGVAGEATLGPRQRASAPSGSRRATIGAAVAPRTVLPPDPARLPARLRGQAAGRVIVHAHVAGRRIESFYVRAEAPGLGASEATAIDGVAELQVPVGMPFNLRVQAEGCVEGRQRQVHLRDGDQARVVRVKLVPRSNG